MSYMENSDDKLPTEQAGAGNTTDASEPPAPEQKSAAPEKPVRKPLISSISQRTTINYILFTLIILALLWAVFFTGIYGFYGPMIENEVENAGRSAAAGFPKSLDGNSIALYKVRLSDLARANKPISAATFVRTDDGKNEVLFIVDDKGVVSDSNSQLFDAVTERMDFDSVFDGNGLEKIGTRFGVYVCYGRKFVTEKNGEKITAYLLVGAPFELFNSQTNKLIYTLIICTGVVLVFASLFSYFASRYQTKRLKDFSQKAKRVASGDYNVEFSGSGYDEYEDLAAALNAATDNMQKAENMQRDIVANISHDIRTPLTMIRAYAEMLRDMPVDEQKRKKTANVIITEADRLTALTSDVLDFSRLQSGVTEFRFDDCDITELASSVTEQFDIVRDRDGIKLEFDAQTTGLTVNCDRQKISQVMYNLITNAINYCGDDKTVIVKVLRHADSARVEVTDHGKGIEQSELDSVWGRYYRSPHSKRRTAGSGLGLSICKTILLSHKAEYGVISTVGEGSTFWFELPIVGKQK